MGKEALFIPGYTKQQEDYPNLARAIRAQGVDMPSIRMRWTNLPSPQLWADQVLDQIDGKEPDIIIGHSYGGAAALVVAADLAKEGRPPKKLILCSHSAVFSDDLEEPVAVRSLMEQYGQIPPGVEQVSAPDLLQTVMQSPKKTEIIIMFGRGELPVIKSRGRRSAHIVGTGSTVVQFAKHSLEKAHYTNAIAAEVARKAA